MYLVELRPGKEELYRSVDELAAAIRSGDVDVHSRIFHRATSKWISITLHPQFKAIAAASESESPPEPQKQWTFLTSAVDELSESAAAGTEATEPASEPPAEPTSENGTSEDGENQASRGWRRPFALGLAGLLLVLGAQLAFSVPRPRWPRFNTATPAARMVVAAPVHRPAVSLASTGNLGAVGYPLPSATETQPVEPAPLPHAPVVRTRGFVDSMAAGAAISGSEIKTVEALIDRYDTAYDEATRQMRSAMDAAQLNGMFAPERLASASAIAELRLGTAAATTIVGTYRGREAEIERAYEDSFTVLLKQRPWTPRQIHQWYGRTSHREPSALKSLTQPLLASVDSLFGVLAANAGAYQVTGESIKFEKVEAAQAYSQLRQQIERQVDQARASGAAASSGTMAALLEAIDTSPLPVESSAR